MLGRSGAPTAKTSRRGSLSSIYDHEVYSSNREEPRNIRHFVQSYTGSQPPVSSQPHLPQQLFYKHHGCSTNTRLEITHDISEDALAALVKNGLQALFPSECNAWKERNRALVDAQTIHVQKESEQMLERLKAGRAQLKSSLHHMMANRVIASFP